MGSRPLRMKVRWGCPPRVLSPPPHRTQSWRPYLPGQPWASGWRSTDRPVPSPRGWTNGFSEQGAAHNRALPRCLPMHHLPLPPGPGLSLPVAVGALLRPPELLRLRPNRYLGRCVEPLAGERRPPRPSQAPSHPGSRRSGPDVGNPEMLEFVLSQEMAISQID